MRGIKPLLTWAFPEWLINDGDWGALRADSVPKTAEPLTGNS